MKWYPINAVSLVENDVQPVNFESHKMTEMHGKRKLVLF